MLAQVPTSRVPAVGVHENVPFQTYRGWDALNHSALRHMSKSPLHYRDKLLAAESESTDSLRFGTLFHALVLEPERFRDLTAAAPINPTTRKPFGSGTKAWADHAAAQPDKILVTTEEMERLAAMILQVQAHRAAQVLFDTAGQREVCIVWNEPVTGKRCKGRIDLLAQVGASKYLRTDIKTTQCARQTSLQKSMIDFGYHTQDEFYARGMWALGMDSSSMIVSVETGTPHDVVVYSVGDETRKAAAAQVGGWLSTLARCEKEDRWPGYADELIQIDAPAWYFKQFADFDN